MWINYLTIIIVLMFQCISMIAMEQSENTNKLEQLIVAKQKDIDDLLPPELWWQIMQHIPHTDKSITRFLIPHLGMPKKEIENSAYTLYQGLIAQSTTFNDLTKKVENAFSYCRHAPTKEKMHQLLKQIHKNAELLYVKQQSIEAPNWLYETEIERYKKIMNYLQQDIMLPINHTFPDAMLGRWQNLSVVTWRNDRLLNMVMNLKIKALILKHNNFLITSCFKNRMSKKALVVIPVTAVWPLIGIILYASGAMMGDNKLVITGLTFIIVGIITCILCTTCFVYDTKEEETEIIVTKDNFFKVYKVLYDELCERLARPPTSNAAQQENSKIKKFLSSFNHAL